jgi:chemotaxis protein methyltransferase CheR
MNQSSAKLPAANREFAFSEADFKFLATLANSKTGIVLAEQKRDMVYGRLARRLRALGLDNFSDYCALLDSPAGGEEIENLINAVTTNLTSFFREPHHFEHLKKEVLPPLVQSGNKKLRLWSSASSSGMEPYSMAMTVRAAIPDIDRWNAKILATDIDSNMVATGAQGEYQAHDVKSVPDAYHHGIRPLGRNRVQMGEELQRMINFKQLNLLEAWPMQGQFDAVFCRNVVIYFDKPTKQKLFERIAEQMKPDGWLYIGHSENLHGISDRFELVGRTIYRRVK